MKGEQLILDPRGFFPFAHHAHPADLDSAVLAYLVSRGLTRTVKAFEKEATVTLGKEGELKKAWEAAQAG